MSALESFIWGAGGAKLTPEQVARRREEASRLLTHGLDFSPVGHWTQGAARVANALVGAIQQRRADTAEKEGLQSAKDDFAAALGYSGLGATSSTSASSTIPTSGAQAELAATGPTQPIDMTGNEVYSGFMDTVKTKVQNPYALAAIAATGNAESKFSPGNVNRTWSDPSESGQAGTAGGIMSWRGPRYQALAATGDLSPQGQANFFLNEDPKLIESLNNAGSVEEAQALMNNAWKFAGYDRSGGEAARRLSSARSYLPTFQGGGEVAAATPEAAIEAIAPIGGAETAPSLSEEVSAFEQTPEHAAQFPGRVQTDTALAGAQPAASQEVAQAMLQGQQPLRSTEINPALIRALENPYLGSSQRAVVEALLKQQMNAMDPAQQLEMEYRRAQIDKMRNEGAAGTAELGLNPQYGVDAVGNPVLIQIGKDGRAVQTAMPDGVSLSKEPIKLDAGTHFVLLDPITRQPVGQVPKDIAGAERERATGKNLAEAQANLSQVEASAGEMLASIESLLNDPYLDRMVGSMDSRLPNFSSDAARVQSKMDQIGGQSFLQAFNMLRGAGQITEQEGAKATSAMGRLNTAQNEKDYREALGELRAVVERAISNARSKAGGLGNQPQSSSGGDDYRTRYGLE